MMRSWLSRWSEQHQGADTDEEDDERDRQASPGAHPQRQRKRQRRTRPAARLVLDLAPEEMAAGEAVVRYMYTQTLDGVDDDEELLHCMLLADRWLLPDCAALCAARLQSTPAGSLSWRVRAAVLALPPGLPAASAHVAQLQARVEAALMRSFRCPELLWEDPDNRQLLLSLPAGRLAQLLLSREDVQVTSENAVLAMLSAWLHHHLPPPLPYNQHANRDCSSQEADSCCCCACGGVGSSGGPPATLGGPGGAPGPQPQAASTSLASVTGGWGAQAETAQPLPAAAAPALTSLREQGAAGSGLATGGSSSGCSCARRRSAGAGAVLAGTGAAADAATGSSSCCSSSSLEHGAAAPEVESLLRLVRYRHLTPHYRAAVAPLLPGLRGLRLHRELLAEAAAEAAAAAAAVQQETAAAACGPVPSSLEGTPPPPRQSPPSTASAPSAVPSPSTSSTSCLTACPAREPPSEPPVGGSVAPASQLGIGGSAESPDAAAGVAASRKAAPLPPVSALSPPTALHSPFCAPAVGALLSLCVDGAGAGGVARSAAAPAAAFPTPQGGGPAAPPAHKTQQFKEALAEAPNTAAAAEAAALADDPQMTHGSFHPGLGQGAAPGLLPPPAAVPSASCLTAEAAGAATADRETERLTEPLAAGTATAATQPTAVSRSTALLAPPLPPRLPYNLSRRLEWSRDIRDVRIHLTGVGGPSQGGDCASSYYQLSPPLFLGGYTWYLATRFVPASAGAATDAAAAPSAQPPLQDPSTAAPPPAAAALTCLPAGPVGGSGSSAGGRVQLQLGVICTAPPGSGSEGPHAIESAGSGFGQPAAPAPPLSLASCTLGVVDAAGRAAWQLVRTPCPLSPAPRSPGSATIASGPGGGRGDRPGGLVVAGPAAAVPRWEFWSGLQGLEASWWESGGVLTTGGVLRLQCTLTLQPC